MVGWMDAEYVIWKASLDLYGISGRFVDALLWIENPHSVL